MHGSISLGQKKEEENERLSVYRQRSYHTIFKGNRWFSGTSNYNLLFRALHTGLYIRVKVRLFMTDKSLQTKNKIIYTGEVFTSHYCIVHCNWIVRLAHSLAVFDAHFERQTGDFL